MRGDGVREWWCEKRRWERRVGGMVAMGEEGRVRKGRGLRLWEGRVRGERDLGLGRRGEDAEGRDDGL
eukprot:3941623-Rhodomonas_salina.1